MEAIKYYVKGAFVGIAETPEVLEQQEELIADLTAKVADLVADGRSEDEALGTAIASMGDLSGLVREFITDEPTAAADEPPAPATAEVYLPRLRLHVVSLTAGGALALLFVMTVLGAVGGAVSASSAVADVMLGMVAIGWIGFELWRFHQDPQAVATIEVASAGLRSRVFHWVVISAFALALNAARGSDFWAWTVWVAAAAWPAQLWLQRYMVERGYFLHPKVEAMPAECADTLVGI